MIWPILVSQESVPTSVQQKLVTDPRECNSYRFLQVLFWLFRPLVSGLSFIVRSDCAHASDSSSYRLDVFSDCDMLH